MKTKSPDKTEEKRRQENRKEEDKDRRTRKKKQPLAEQKRRTRKKHKKEAQNTTATQNKNVNNHGKHYIQTSQESSKVKTTEQKKNKNRSSLSFLYPLIIPAAVSQTKIYPAERKTPTYGLQKYRVKKNIPVFRPERDPRPKY